MKANMNKQQIISMKANRNKQQIVFIKTNMKARDMNNYYEIDRLLEIVFIKANSIIQ